MKNIYKGIILLFLILIMASCTEGLTTIFQTINNDTKIDDGSLPNDLLIGGIAQRGTDYYIASIALRTRTVGSATWSAVATGASGNHNTVATNGTTIYVGVADDSGGGNLYSSPDGIAWAVAAKPADFQQAVKIKFTASGYLMSYKKTGNSWSLSDNGFTEFVTVAANALTAPIEDMISGPIYVSGNAVYNNGTPITPTGYDTLFYTSLGYNASTAPNPTYFLGTQQGYIFYFNGGGTPASSTWVLLGQYNFPPTGKQFPVHFKTFTHVNGTDYMLVGTANAGLYIIDQSSGTPVLEHFGDASKPALYSGGITAIHNNAGTILIGSAKNGLWRNTFAGGTWTGEWFLE